MGMILAAKAVLVTCPPRFSVSILVVPLVVTTSSLLFEITSVTLPKLPNRVSKSTIFPLASLR